jgi:hypothetical protein
LPRWKECLQGLARLNVERSLLNQKVDVVHHRHKIQSWFEAWLAVTLTYFASTKTSAAGRIQLENKFARLRSMRPWLTVRAGSRSGSNRQRSLRTKDLPRTTGNSAFFSITVPSEHREKKKIVRDKGTRLPGKAFNPAEVNGAELSGDFGCVGRAACQDGATSRDLVEKPSRTADR